MSPVGASLLRLEDARMLTAGATYVDDLVLDGALHAVFVRSTMAHADVVSIDIAEARRHPGVVSVFTAEDLSLPPLPPEPGMSDQAMPEPLLATGVVRFVGEPVAVVVALSRDQAVDAAELVVVDYEPRHPVVTVEEALSDGVLLHEASGTNTCLKLAFARPATRADDLFAECEVVVTARIVNQRLAPCPLEPRAGAAAWEGGRLVYWAPTQGVHQWRSGLARRLGLAEDDVRVCTPDVGGAFGSKAACHREDAVVAWAARALGRPVRWVETRTESMVGLPHGRGQMQHVTLGGTADGRLLAYRLDVAQDAGAYPRVGAVLPFATRTMLTGVYDIPRAKFTSAAVVTNTTPVGAYRGAGRPEATAAIERAVDLFALEVGMDPVELRRRNFVTPDRFPWTSPTRARYDSGDYEQALDAVLQAVDYHGLRDEQRRRREASSTMQLGMGLSVYVEITNPDGGGERARIELHEDGTVIVRSGAQPHGQGLDTALAAIAADVLGVAVEDVVVAHGDSDALASGGGTSGSRSLQTAGPAVAEAARLLVDEARDVAAKLIAAAPDEIAFDATVGCFRSATYERPVVGWREIGAASGGLAVEAVSTPGGATFPFGAHAAVVEVDTETGGVRLLKLVAVDDAGRVVNPLLFEGQVHGGLAQGVAQALFEEMAYDGEGNPITATFADYGIPGPRDLPSFTTVAMETPTPNNELGVKGIGESGAIGAPPAVQNAVVDAVAHLGVRHIDMPLTPMRVWQAIEAARL
ncbi:MAG: xanthine dehydrogenase family protein molybdopterin-binding subunit [Actinobacteria bacterium]|nr:xanthine dehydrogenase family protein molybdopterin-binding subunit [Actinomycetota bacterium]